MFQRRVPRIFLILSLWITTTLIIVVDVDGQQQQLNIHNNINNDKNPKQRTTLENENEETIIRFGTSVHHHLQYHPPFITPNYPSYVVNVLKQYPEKSKFLFDDEDDDVDEDDDDNKKIEEMYQLELASWYIDLGLAHRTVMEDYYIEELLEDDSNDDDNDNDLQRINTYRNIHIIMNDLDLDDVDDKSRNNNSDRNMIKIQKAYAVAAFQEAIQIYETLIKNYHPWIRTFLPNDDSIGDMTFQQEFVASSTLDVIQQLINEYEILLANSIFALAETYTLLNENEMAFQYYYRAHHIYQQKRLDRPEGVKHDDPNENNQSSSNNMDHIHYAHCAVQLGLESIQHLHDMDDENDLTMTMGYDDKPDHTKTMPNDRRSLSDIMEKSILSFDHQFWKSYLISLWQDSDDNGDFDNDGSTSSGQETNRFTLESVKDYMMLNHQELFNNDVVQIELSILRYILIEQVIVYFTNAIPTFRQVSQQHITTPKTSNRSNSMILDNQQTLVNALQNLATCLYQYRSISITAMTDALDYYEEAYDVLSLQIMPSILQLEPTMVNRRSSDEIKRTVHTMIDILFILTEIYFQLGDDEMSKDRMQMCLQYHEEYQLDPPSIDPLMHGSTSVMDEMLIMENETPISRKDLLVEYEQLLENYFSLIADNDFQQYSMNDDPTFLEDESSGYYYEKNDSYKADIHVSIGTLYMGQSETGISTSRITDAMIHFEQAIRLYEISGNVDGNTNMALAKYNLFLLHLRDGNFRMAVRRYNDAIDLFRKIELHTTDVTHVYDSFNDASLFSGSTNAQQHRTSSKWIKEPYQSSEQQEKRFVKVDTGSFKTTSRTVSATNTETKNNDESTTLNPGKPSIYVDLQHFLAQNQSTKENR